MIVRRELRYNYYQRRRSARVRMLLLFTTLMVGAMVLIMTNLPTVQNVAAQAMGIQAAPTPYPAEYAMLGAQAFQSGNMSEAARHFERAVQLQPNNVAYLYEYGKTLIEMNDTTGASEIADRAIAVAPNDVRGYALKANALAYIDPTNALIYALQGEEIDRNFAPLYSAMAISNTLIYRFSQAIIAGERAIELDPEDANTHRAYAVPLIYTGRTEEVIEQLEYATSINPNLPNAWFELAAQYKNVLINRPRQALAIYNYMVENLTMSVEDTAKAYLRICETYAAAEDADFVAATTNCERALQIKPDYGSVYGQLGQMQYARRNYEGSIETFRTCIGFDPEELRCYAYRGLAHFWMNECDDAWTVLNEAQTLGTAQGLAADNGVMQQIGVGIGNVIAKCPDYSLVAAPTVPPPTAIPPTPIGGL